MSGNLVITKKLRWLPAIFIMLIVWVSCHPESKEIRKYNVILIVIDTWRYDTLNSKINGVRVTPEIDAFAKQSVVFKNAYSQSPWTLPSFATLLTSTYPSVHGARCIGIKKYGRLSDDVKTLAQVMDKSGFKTYAVVCNAFLTQRFRMNRGFEAYDYYQPTPEGIRKADETFLTGLSWIKDNMNDRNFFAMLHLFDPHMSYEPPEEFAEIFDPSYQGNYKKSFSFLEETIQVKKNKIDLSAEEKIHVRNLYNAEVAFCDREFGKFIRSLTSLGLLENTVILLTADHGEEFWDHDSFEHGHTVYDELVHVPLMVRFPDQSGIPAKEVDLPVGLIDVMPTVLDFMNIPVPVGIQGRSLLPGILTSQIKEEPLYCEALFFADEKISARDSRYKYIKTAGSGGRVEFYDLQEDPEEKVNLIDSKKPAKKRLKKMLVQWYKSNKKQAGKQHEADPKKDTLEKLRALGYVQ